MRYRRPNDRHHVIYIFAESHGVRNFCELQNPPTFSALGIPVAENRRTGDLFGLDLLRNC